MQFVTAATSNLLTDAISIYFLHNYLCTSLIWKMISLSWSAMELHLSMAFELSHTRLAHKTYLDPDIYNLRLYKKCHWTSECDCQFSKIRVYGIDQEFDSVGQSHTFLMFLNSPWLCSHWQNVACLEPPGVFTLRVNRLHSQTCSIVDHNIVYHQVR